eukprot:2207852-Pleurochrysis_carterae.AAC.1
MRLRMRMQMRECACPCTHGPARCIMQGHRKPVCLLGSLASRHPTTSEARRALAQDYDFDAMLDDAADNVELPS